jgi:quinol-cytochrome oxidoreductase complex cytochrome b subunit
MQHERGWRLAVYVALLVVTLLFVVLVVTGVWLSLRYEPSVRSPFVSGGAAPGMVSATRSTHAIAAYSLVLAVATLGIVTIALFAIRRQWWRVIVPLGGGLLALLSAFTGYLLPWDQLSLHAVTVGTRITGYGPILRGDNVKYVLIGTAEVSSSTLSEWFWIHTVVLSGAMLLALISIALLARRGQPARSGPAA